MHGRPRVQVYLGPERTGLRHASTSSPATTRATGACGILHRFLRSRTGHGRLRPELRALRQAGLRLGSKTTRAFMPLRSHPYCLIGALLFTLATIVVLVGIWIAPR